MSDFKAFGHLVWKDFRSVLPLFIAPVIALSLAITLICNVSTFEADSKSDQLILFLGILMPGIFAYAAGPVLVGTEEESGTLSWLSGLPVSWVNITFSKILVSLVCYVLIAIISYSLVVFVLRSSVDRFDTIYELRQDSMYYRIYFGCFLLMLGFLCAYLVRSPVGSLVLLAPLTAILHASIGTSLYDVTSPHNSFVNTFEYAFIFLTFVALTFGVFWFSRLRMQRPWTMTKIGSVVPETLEIYQPPKSISLYRPSLWGAFFWQQWRSYWPTGSAVLALAALPSVLNSEQHGLYYDGWNMWAAVLGSAILGTMTFYGDSVKNRCLFIGERGLNTIGFWFSHLILSAGFFIICLAISIGPLYGAYVRRDEIATVFVPVLTVCLLVWCVGVLSPMLIKRPILAFFFPVVVLTAVAIPFVVLYLQYFDRYVWTVALASPFILLAAWNLCERWVTRRLGIGFYARALGYSALGLLAPILCITCIRVASAPSVDPHWQKKMLTYKHVVDNTSPVAPSLPHSPAITAVPLTPDRIRQIEAVTVEQLRQEREEKEPIGHFVPYELVAPLAARYQANEDPEFDEKKQLALEIWVSFPRRVREAMCNGQADPTAFLVAEEHERHVVNLLQLPSWPKEQTAKLLPLLSTKDLRERSRVAAIARMWLDFDRTKNFEDRSKRFAGITLDTRPSWLPFENWRQNMLIDKAAELMTQQVESDENFLTFADQVIVLDLLCEAFNSLASPQFNQSRVDGYWKESQLGWIFGMAQAEEKIRNIENQRGND